MASIPKRVLCVFAHPDDEAFGPSGTIAKFADEGEVYLVCVTNGNDQTNGAKTDLVKLRNNELNNSAKILGVKRVFFLDYPDGDLSSNLYHEVAKDIQKLVKRLKPDTLLTFETRGVSGHIDHIFCSMVTTYVFYKEPIVNKLYYYTAKRMVTEKMKDYFIYFPPGHNESEVDKVVDISKYWDKKINAIKAHKTQIKDGKRVLNNLAKLPKTELFFIKKK